MSYMLLFKNANGAVLAADTRVLNISMLPARKTDNGKKIVYSTTFKFTISLLGAGSYNSQSGLCVYIQDYLERYIKDVMEKNHAFFATKNLSKIILGFLHQLIQHRVLNIHEISELSTIFTGVRWNNHQFETIDVKAQDLAPFLTSTFTETQLNQKCQYKTYQPSDVGLISGGDHILAWVSGKKQIFDHSPAQFMQDYAIAIAQMPLAALQQLVTTTIQGIISQRGDPSIGVFIDVVTIDPAGNLQATIHNPGRANESSLTPDFTTSSNYLSDPDSAIAVLEAFEADCSAIPDSHVRY